MDSNRARDTENVTDDKLLELLLEVDIEANREEIRAFVEGTFNPKPLSEWTLAELRDAMFPPFRKL